LTSRISLANAVAIVFLIVIGALVMIAFANASLKIREKYFDELNNKHAIILCLEHMIRN